MVGRSTPAAARAVAIASLLFLLTLPAVTTRFYANDEIEYFAWLRSAAFDRDADFENEYLTFYESGATRDAGFHETFLERRNEAGRRYNFAPIGTALLWTPFFAAGHLIAIMTGAPADGYSAPYLTAVTWGSAFYGFLAVVLAAAIARRIVGAGAVAASVVVWLGTPLIFYMYVAPGFSHACSAFAVSLFLFTWLKVRERWTTPGLVLLGVTGGLMATVREQDVFFLLGPAIDCGRAALFTAETSSVRTKVAGGIAGVAAFLIVYAPQVAAYQALNGHPGPTTAVARKMTWTSPHFIEVLVSSQHGLFFWTPLALVGLAGLFVLVVRPTLATDVRWIVTLCLAMWLLQVYVSGCVESWTVAGSFGQRRFVALTPLVTVGVAGLWQLAFQARSGLVRGLWIGLLTLCVWWNIGLMAQFGLHLMDRQRLAIADNARITFLRLPPMLPSIAWRYLTDRSSFYGLPRQ